MPADPRAGWIEDDYPLGLLVCHLSADARVKHLASKSARPAKHKIEPTACGKTGRWVQLRRHLPICKRCTATITKKMLANYSGAVVPADNGDGESEHLGPEMEVGT